MARQHGARQQKRVAKQRAKQKQRSRQLARQRSNNPAIMFQGADNWPVVDALEFAELWQKGIGNILISRRMPDGRIATAVFLIDAWCLGVKDVFWRTSHPADYPAFKADVVRRGDYETVSPQRLSKIAHCAADYAQSIGIAPHRDFRFGRMLLSGIDPSQCNDELTFGQDGKPFFFAGPYDTPERCRQIAALIKGHGGEYVIPIVPRSGEEFGESFEFDELIKEHGGKYVIPKVPRSGEEFGETFEFDEERGDLDDEEGDDAIDVVSSQSGEDDEPHLGLPVIPKFRP